MSGRILAVDPGEKRLGIAISDPTGVLASPLRVIFHISRAADAAAIVQIAHGQDAVRIIVGQPLDQEGQPNTPEARHSARLAEAIQQMVEIPVELWDESGTTQAAQAVRREMGVTRRKRSGHLDELAAAVILQDYLDSHQQG